MGRLIITFQNKGLILLLLQLNAISCIDCPKFVIALVKRDFEEDTVNMTISFGGTHNE